MGSAFTTRSRPGRLARSTLACVTAALTLLAASPVAQAQASAKDRALRLFEQSAEAYEAGELEKAAELLERAYALDPDPTLLYNLARTYEGLGKLECLLDAGRGALHGDGDGPL